MHDQGQIKSNSDLPRTIGPPIPSQAVGRKTAFVAKFYAAGSSVGTVNIDSIEGKLCQARNLTL